MVEYKKRYEIYYSPKTDSIFDKGTTVVVIVHAKFEIKETTHPNLSINLRTCYYVEEFISGISVYENGKEVMFGRVASLIPYYQDFIKKYPELKELAEIESRWDLNGMRAGTKKQEDYIRYYEARGNKYNYDLIVEELKRVFLYEDRGYKYGEAWLCEKLPRGLKNKVKKLLRV